MKKLICLAVLLTLLSCAFGQLKVKTLCPAFDVDLLDGKVNGLKPDATTYDIKTKFPCFTSLEEDGSAAKCGSGVFFKDKDIYFYTQRDYIEIGEKFKGKLSIPLIGTKRGTMFKYLGNPKMRDATWEAYQTQYGIIILYYNAAGKVNKIVFSTKGTDNINLCE